MIKIDVVIEDDGTLRACKASGNDIVCAAVSVLIRTTLSVLSGRKGIVVKGDAPEKGEFWLEADYTAEGKDFLFAVGDFLINGLSSVTREFPDNCELNFVRRT